MKSKRLSRKKLIVVLLFGLAIGFGMPNHAGAGSCYYEGYVVQVVQVGATGWFHFREKPIDAGYFHSWIGNIVVDTEYEIVIQNTLRSAQQNNTKLGFSISTPGACPNPNLSLPGMTSTGETHIVYTLGNF